jgi:hypothetical protein
MFGFRGVESLACTVALGKAKRVATIASVWEMVMVFLRSTELDDARVIDTTKQARKILSGNNLTYNLSGKLCRGEVLPILNGYQGFLNHGRVHG